MHTGGREEKEWDQEGTYEKRAQRKRVHDRTDTRAHRKSSSCSTRPHKPAGAPTVQNSAVSPVSEASPEDTLNRCVRTRPASGQHAHPFPPVRRWGVAGLVRTPCTRGVEGREAGLGKSCVRPESISRPR